MLEPSLTASRRPALARAARYGPEKGQAGVARGRSSVHCEPLHEERASHRPFRVRPIGTSQQLAFIPGGESATRTDTGGRARKPSTGRRPSFGRTQGSRIPWSPLSSSRRRGARRAMWTTDTGPFTFLAAGASNRVRGKALGWSGQRWDGHLRVVCPSYPRHSTAPSRTMDLSRNEGHLGTPRLTSGRESQGGGGTSAAT